MAVAARVLRIIANVPFPVEIPLQCANTKLQKKNLSCAHKYERIRFLNLRQNIFTTRRVTRATFWPDLRLTSAKTAEVPLIKRVRKRKKLSAAPDAREDLERERKERNANAERTEESVQSSRVLARSGRQPGSFLMHQLRKKKKKDQESLNSAGNFQCVR